MPRRSTTGPASISAPMSAARSPATTISTASRTGNNGNGRFLGGLQAGADWQFNPNWVVGVEAQYSWLSGNVGAVFPGGFAYTNNQRGLGSITGRVGYTWGPGLRLREGRLRLFRQQRERDGRRRAGRASSSLAITATATPSAPASNTCSRRTGRPRPSTSTTISATPTSPRRPAGADRQLHHRRPRHQGGRQLPLQLGEPVVARY